MKVLFIITGLAMGGAETQVTSVADKLADRGRKVTIAYLLKPVLVKPSNASVELLWLGGDKSILGMVKAYFNLAKIIRTIKPDVVHSHMFHANMLTRCARFTVRFPRLICTAHNTNEGGKLRTFAYRLTDKLADEFTNVSREAVEAFEKAGAVPQARMLATHNGIDVDRFNCNLSRRVALRAEFDLQNHKVFIAIGRFHKQKDYPNLLTAFADYLQSQKNSHLLIVGDGELRVEIECLIQKLNIHQYVTLLGVRNDVPDLLSAADIFVLSSASEGFGLVVAEAMATERVAIATDCGGVAEVMGDIGFLVPPSDSNALCDAMHKAAGLSVSEAKQVGELARQRIVEKYSLDAVVDRWEEIYLKGGTYDN